MAAQTYVIATLYLRYTYVIDEFKLRLTYSNNYRYSYVIAML